MRPLIALALLPIALSGCAVFALGAAGETGESAVEERSFGTKIDDQATYVNVNDQFIKSGSDGLAIDATVNVRFGRVMLTGNVASKALADKAVAAAWKAKGVKEVINELVVNPDAGFSDEANDIAIKKNLVARLIITKDVWYINYSIDVVNGVAYLLGRTKDRAEMDRVLNVARTTKGVKKVVNHLQVAPSDANDATSAPNATDTAAPVATIVHVPANHATAVAPSAAPTDGTISTDAVTSSDVSAPNATTPAIAPMPPAASSPAKTPTWR